jgi:tetratricopeptide (TPR) repeat protein
MNRTRSRRPAPAGVVCALLVALTAAVFARVGTHPFAGFDDNVYVWDNLTVRDGLTPRGLAWAFSTMHAANWHPLTWLSHMLDAQLFGLRPGLHHLTSLALHAANATLLFLALRAMTGALWPPAVVAALFAVHPLHVESVAWIAERKDVLSTLFWMLALLAWVRYARRPSAGRYLAAAALFALGLLAKPMLVTLPLALLLLDAWPLGRMGPGVPRPRRAAALLLEKAPLLALSAASSAVTVVAQRSGNAVISTWLVPVSSRVANALASWLRYAQKMFWPSGLGLFYPLAWKNPPAWKIAGAALALGALTAAVLRLWSRRPWLAVGWLWYLGTLVPVIGLVQVGMQGMADRYTYVPLVGLFVAIAWTGADLAARPRLAPAVAACAAAAVAACAVTAWFQVERWRDDQSLFGGTIAATGQNWLAELNLGVNLYHQKRYDEAIAHYEAARGLMPMYADVYYNLALAYTAQNRLDKALEAYQTAATIKPGDADTQNNLGTVLMQLGRFEEALARFQAAVRAQPDDDVAYTNIGILYGKIGRRSQSEAALAEAQRIKEARRAAHPSLR